MPRMLLTKKFEFDAAHQLGNAEDAYVYGKCGNLHGHRWTLEVTVTGIPDRYGMIINYKDLSSVVKQAVLDRFDHSFLNEVVELPTSEVLVKYIANQIDQVLIRDYPGTVKLVKVTLYETPTSYIEYEVI